jgi:protein-S-isoprenylcysteine O-methyltransferase Ste14
MRCSVHLPGRRDQWATAGQVHQRVAGGMMFQAILMGLMATLSFVSAGDWFVKHDIAAGITFLGFGIGYVGLMWLFSSTIAQ